MRSRSEPSAAPSDGCNSRCRHDASAISASAYAARFSGDGDGGIVAAVFAFLANAPGDPPDARVEEQQRFGNRLQQVDRIVAAADVRELVGDERLDLRRAHVRQRGERQHDERLQPADQDWRVDHRGLDDAERNADAQAPGETFGSGLPG